MQLPGATEQPNRSGSGDPYQPAPVTLSEQAGSGGIDRDGTDGVIDPDGTNGSITGPIVSAVPAIRANAAPTSPRVKS